MEVDKKTDEYILIPKSRTDYFDPFSVNQESINREIEKKKLSLRKNHIFDALLTKRKESLSMLSSQTRNKNSIKISEVSNNITLKEDPDNFIKSTPNIFDYFQKIYNQNFYSNFNLNELKESLFILQKFISLQIKENIDIKKRKLSNNDSLLIEKLCDFLFFKDLQIVYTSCCCLINLTFFPLYIQNLLMSDKNLEKFMKFFFMVDFNFGNEFLYLFLNINTNNKVRKFFIENNGLQRLFYFMKQKAETSYDFQSIIFLLRIFINVTKITENNESERNCLITEEEINKYNEKFLGLLPLLKKITISYFIQNIWINGKDEIYFINIFEFYAKMYEIKVIKKILESDFSQQLIEMYYKTSEEQNKIKLMKVFVIILSSDLSDIEKLVEEGISQLFLSEMNRCYENRNYELLDLVINCCRNIADGTVEQIENLNQSGIYWKILDILKNLLFINDGDDIKSFLVNNIIINCLFTLTNAITGDDINAKAEIVIYQEYLIIEIFLEIFKNYEFFENSGDNENNELLNMIIFSIDKLIETEESEMDEENVEKFRYKLNGLEDLLINISNNNFHNIVIKDSVLITINKIIEFIRDGNYN